MRKRQIAVELARQPIKPVNVVHTLIKDDHVCKIDHDHHYHDHYHHDHDHEDHDDHDDHDGDDHDDNNDDHDDNNDDHDDNDDRDQFYTHQHHVIEGRWNFFCWDPS